MEYEDKSVTEPKAKAVKKQHDVEDKAQKAESVAFIKNADNASRNEPTFTIDALRASARNLFGVSQSTYDAATSRLHGCFTVESMKQEIEKWLKEGY